MEQKRYRWKAIGPMAAGFVVLLGCLLSVLYVVLADSSEPAPETDAVLRDLPPAPMVTESDAVPSAASAPKEQSVATETTEPIAEVRTAVQPSLTLAGHLELRARALPWGEPGKVQRAPDISLDNALESPMSNPNKKTLKLEVQRELAVLLAELDAAYETQSLEYWKAMKEVLLRAIARGNIRSLSHETQVADPNDLFAIAAASRANNRGMMARMKEAMDELSSTYGPVMKDWGYSDMASSEPDGVSRNNIVYWTRAEEPEFFRLQDQFGAMQKRHWGIVRDFIDRH